jgi:hypothetical protein
LWDSSAAEAAGDGSRVVGRVFRAVEVACVGNRCCSTPIAGSVAGRWPSLLPPRPSAVAGRAPEGFPKRRPSSIEIEE